MVYIDGAKDGDPRVPIPIQPPSTTATSGTHRPPLPGPPAFDDGSLGAAPPPSTTSTSSAPAASPANAASGAGSVAATRSASAALPALYQQYQQPGPSVMVRHPAPGAAYGSMTAAPYGTIAINTGAPSYAVVATQPQYNNSNNGMYEHRWRAIDLVDC